MNMGSFSITTPPVYTTDSHMGRSRILPRFSGGVKLAPTSFVLAHTAYMLVRLTSIIAIKEVIHL